MDSLVVLGLPLTLIAVAAIWVLWRRRVGARARLNHEGVQEIDVVVNKGYHPEAVIVRQDIPLRLVFDRREDTPCSEWVIFSDFHDHVRLPAFRRTAVELIPTRSGEFLFTCSFGMYQGRLIVEEPVLGSAAVEQAITKARYNRIAPLYDIMEALTERLAFQRWREKLWAQVRGPHILEVGVGTGKNMPYYPAGAQVTAIDLSDRMLERAQRKTKRLGLTVDLREMDAQALAFPAATFDSAVATFVFCSVPDPVQGLREMGRVVKPGGRILLLEHVRVDRPVIGPLMDLLNPLVVRLWGANINRQTVENVRRAGLNVESIEDLRHSGLVKLIVVRAR